MSKIYTCQEGDPLRLDQPRIYQGKNNETQGALVNLCKDGNIGAAKRGKAGQVRLVSDKTNRGTGGLA